MKLSTTYEVYITGHVQVYSSKPFADVLKWIWFSAHKDSNLPSRIEDFSIESVTRYLVSDGGVRQAKKTNSHYFQGPFWIVANNFKDIHPKVVITIFS